MPKILASGRGGSGKSTLVSLLAKELSGRGTVLVVDADESNLGLSAMLGLEPPPQSIMDYLGGKPAVRDKLLAMIRGEGGEKVPLFEDQFTVDALPSECTSRKDGLSLVRIGKIEHSMEGCACPMGAVARAFLNQLAVADDQWVLVDTEAGIEHFGRGVLEGVDTVILVVDPSHEAVILSEKASQLCREADKPFVLVLNKVDGETETMLREMLSTRGLQPMGALPYSHTIVQANLAGHALDERSMAGEIDDILAALE